MARSKLRWKIKDGNWDSIMYVVATVERRFACVHLNALIVVALMETQVS